MTTISPRKRKIRPSLSTVITVIVLAVLVSAVGIWRQQTANIFWTAVAPLESLRNSFDSGENSRLRAELASTTAALADRTMLYEENLRLKAEFGRDAKAHMVLAGVLMRPPGVPYDTLLIDAGRIEGVVPGALVSAGGNAYIGTVSEVYDSNARVALFSSPGSTYDALLILSAKSGASIPISLVGDGAGSMSAQIPSATPVSVGDAVVIPGIVPAFAGVVSHIDRPVGESFETLYTHLPVDLFSLQFVEVRTAL